ncbi:Transcriptional regulatory protein YpdB [Jeotgalicoccus saudimassiliensis]|uniref:Transcriptional regulatory protein YpdB n=1 Tax=Jeotgalicoccus saudimassiliensis TaxID=1461582 RepID=A0A078MD73_9STAP|nr:LytTR family DNA-binding domain-containing protein [Jeotgalicoccus saudimassiliensis]CEA02656.1 Transcriptional regulatory protein YpdB [Jeotgalicoccus saudimassiliensis]
MEIPVQKLTDSQTDGNIIMTAGETLAVQIPYERLGLFEKTLQNEGTHVFSGSLLYYKRMNLKVHIEYLRKWYNSQLKTEDLIRQFNIADVSLRMSKQSRSEIQKLTYIHALLSGNKHIVFIDPFINTVTDNIHLFHKMKEQLMQQGKSLFVATSRLEDAFIVQPDVMKLTEKGLQIVETADNTEEDGSQNVSKIKVRAHDKTIFVTIGDIEYLESQDGKVYINLGSEKFIMESTLQAAEEQLGGHGFYRCHRSYIVNLHKVKEIITWSKNTYSVIISNPEKSKIPLSRAKFNEIQEKLVKL